MLEAQPIELERPDIAPLRQSASGVEYVHVLDSGLPGPNVMLQALTHGNEICGAIALCWLWAQAVRPLRRARLLQPFVDAADYLLDIHSMHQACRPIC